MAFVLSYKILQSSNGQVLTIQDNSTYGQDGVTLDNILSRVVSITDVNDVVVGTVTFDAGSLTATYNITEDQYLHFLITLTKADTSTLTELVNYMSTAFYEIAFTDVIKRQGCSCECSPSFDLQWSNYFKIAADVFAVRGLSVAAQNNISAANVLIAD